MQTLAAVDIGSNSCRLKIARIENHRLKVLHEDREVTRLGASVFEGGMISPDAMATTLRALKRFYKAVQVAGADRVRAVATSALRDARNAQAFVAWVKSETGWDLEIISGLEEARLIHRGVMQEARTQGRCLLVDLGGGSCEITLSDRRRIVETVSLPLGAVRLTEEFLHERDPPVPEDIARMKRFIRRELARAGKRFGGLSRVPVIATSGTAAALVQASVGIKSGARPEKRAKSAARTAETRAVRRLATKLPKLTNQERSKIPGVGPRRAEIIVAGAAVYAELLEHFGLQGFRYSDLGLRDGVLAQMFAEQDARTSAHQQFERDRWESVLATCKRYGVDPRVAEPVRAHAAQLFRDLQSMHGLPADYRQWLEAAAMMRDVGKYINYQGHHRHTQYVIAGSELYGFTPPQRAIVSGIARYLGKSRPAPQDRAFRYIAPAEHDNVKRAIVLLRLAVALNQDRASDVLRVTVRAYPKRVLVEIQPGRTGAELELWSLRKEADYFREIFRRELFAALA
ncbi:MAG TPA: Ppx/GppA phosphatase family protein [Acidobacteriaceae bacterium]|jgi:exopolyphosphatase/guanosine-5'-triphosphate,3'-diphosphate pyrophosphatase